MELKPGEKLGRYELLSPIGEGGMGEVWKARDTQLDRDVALKVSKDAFTARFDREARAIAAFNHPNICQIYDVGPNYLVMELIDGVPLKGPLPVEKAVAYAGLILDALDAAHRKGFTHRDLKPANVLTTKQGLKLLDFGLAKQRAATLGPDDVTGSPMTKDGRITGTLQYMSPEQLQGKEADARSDIFAFGCVLYEMLSGRKAFSGSTTASVIAAIMEREPEPLQTTPPLDRVIRTCLCKDPDERFQSARDVKKALLWAAESAPGVPLKKVRAPWIFAAAMGLLAGSALLYSFGVARRPAAPPVNAVPVVVLMDTSAPEGVYDPETRKKSGTNADDISDALNNLPVAIHKETVGSTWNREDQVLKQIPDLIVIHRSAFIHAIVLDFQLGYPALGDSNGSPESKASPPPSRQILYNRLTPIGADKLEAFLGYAAGVNPRTRFLIYSRRWMDAARLAWQQNLERRFPALNGRVFTMSVEIRDGTASFRDPKTAAQVTQAVRSSLALSTSGSKK